MGQLDTRDLLVFLFYFILVAGYGYWVYQRKKYAHHDSKDSWLYSKIDGTYIWLLKLAMRFRWAVVLLCVIAVASIYPLFNWVGMAFLPDEDESAFHFNLRGSQGMRLSATQSGFPEAAVG